MDRRNNLRRVKFYIQWLIDDGIWEAMPSAEEILKKLEQIKVSF